MISNMHVGSIHHSLYLVISFAFRPLINYPEKSTEFLRKYLYCDMTIAKYLVKTQSPQMYV